MSYVDCFEDEVATSLIEKICESNGVSIVSVLPFIETGVAGNSTTDEFQRRHEKREAQIEAKYGMFAGIVKFMSDDPQSTICCKNGLIREQKLASALVPKGRANIDNVAISPSGVWVIDA